MISFFEGLDGNCIGLCPLSGEIHPGVYTNRRTSGLHLTLKCLGFLIMVVTIQEYWYCNTLMMHRRIVQLEPL